MLLDDEPRCLSHHDWLPAWLSELTDPHAPRVAIGTASGQLVQVAHFDASLDPWLNP